MDSNISDDPDTLTLKLFAGDGLGSPSKLSFIFGGLDTIIGIKLVEFDIYGLGNQEFNDRTKIIKNMNKLIEKKFLCSNISQEEATNLGIERVRMILNGDIKLGALAYTTQDTSLIATDASDLKFNDFNAMLKEHSEFIKMCDSVLLCWHAASFNIDSFNLEPENYKLLCNKIQVVFGGHKQTKTVTRIPIGSDGETILYVDGGATNAATVGVTNLSFNMKTRRFESAEAKFVDTLTTTTPTPIRTYITNLVNNLAAPALKEPITTIKNNDLNGLSLDIKKGPTNLTTVIADAYWYNGSKMISNVKPENICAVFNVGSVRNNSIIKIGTILDTGLLYSILPFNNSLVAIKVQGFKNLSTLLEYLGTTSSTKIGGNGFLGTSSNLSIDYANKQFRIVGSSESETESYCVVMPDFLQLGGDGYTMLKNYEDVLKLDTLIQTAFRKFIVEKINSV